MKISDLKDRKKEMGYSNHMISELSGVPLSTVQKIFGGATETPRYETLKKIEDVLFPKGRYEYSNPLDDYDIRRMHVAEPTEAYAYAYIYGYDPDLMINGKRQGEFTIGDVMKLPEGSHGELIDGVIYDKSMPTTVHQSIVSRVYVQIANAIDEFGGKCTSFGSPVDVQLDLSDEKDMLAPDLIVVCDRSKLSNDDLIVIGAPDFVMEVLSPSTMGKDRVLKYHKYMSYGVREYWIVDPFKREIVVSIFSDDARVSYYGFDDKVPITIFDKKVAVDFARISRYLEEHLNY